jgi:4-hydroxy-4-methyl-2-oxoglutarate aldolase
MPGQPVRPEVLKALQTLNTPTVANAIETFDVRPRSTGFLSSAVRCALPNLGVMVGFAATAKIRATRKPDHAPTSP